MTIAIGPQCSKCGVSGRLLLKRYAAILVFLSMTQVCIAEEVVSEIAELAVRHSRGQDGWSLTETANFCIYHGQSRAIAEKAARTAEQVRTRMADKWFGGFKESWSPRCEVILHDNADDFSRSTGVPRSAPGRSSIKTDAGRVISRRIDLHCDDVEKMLACVLPHETTHVVLAGQFGGQQIPRWADEGMAILSEPGHRVDKHLTYLENAPHLFGVGDLMRLTSYPEREHLSLFYAQSVSIVEFLASEKGPEVFTRFLREAMRGGYEASLRRHYGYDLEDLQFKWSRKALAAAGTRSDIP